MRSVSFSVTSNSYCSSCNLAVESCLHLLRDCKLACEAWHVILIPNMRTSFFNLPFHDWIKANLSITFHDGLEERWDRFFIVVLWWLWKWRNDWIFNDVEVNMQSKLPHLSNVCNHIDMGFANDKWKPTSKYYLSLNGYPLPWVLEIEY